MQIRHRCDRCGANSESYYHKFLKQWICINCIEGLIKQKLHWGIEW